MSEWITENPKIVKSILSQQTKAEKKKPVLTLRPNKLYEVLLLDNPHNVEGTEGYVVKIRNRANGIEYLLFLQKTLHAKFREANAKKDDTLYIINKGKNMQTGYDYTVFQRKAKVKKKTRRFRRGRSSVDSKRY